MLLIDYLQHMESRCDFHQFNIENVIGVTPQSCIDIGGWFVAADDVKIDNKRNKNGPFVVSIKHGRSIVYWYKDKWVSIKGIGWTIGAAPIVRSIKDERLVFGLFGIEEAKREVQVSAYFQNSGLDMPVVLGYTPLYSEVLPAALQNIEDIKYSDGVLVKPGLVYMQCLSPIRVADLPYLITPAREAAIKEAQSIRGWNNECFVDRFIETLGYNIGCYHSAGCVNDSMHFDNVTLCAEIVDFEWISVPGIPLPNGDSLEDGVITSKCITLRQEKELLYAIEVGMELSELIGEHTTFKKASSLLSDGYSKARIMVLSKFKSCQYMHDWSPRLEIK